MNIEAAGRRTGGEDPLEGIQILRAVAALLVVLLHTLAESASAASPLALPDWFMKFGAVGVDIFFVISGFIMFRVSFPANRPAVAPATFLLKRLTRIYPVYWFVVALTLGLWGLGLLPLPHLDPKMLSPPTEAMLLRSLLLLPTQYFIIAIAWTLIYEMYFYVVFGATLYFAKPLVSVMASSAIIIFLYAVHDLAPDKALAEFLANPIAIEFCLGLLLGYLLMRWPKLAAAPAPLFVPALALLTIGMLAQPYASAHHPPSFSRVLQWGVPAFLLVGAAVSLKPDRRPLRRRLLLLGDASYAIYLTHPLAIIYYAMLLEGALSNVPQWPVVPVVIGLAAGFGVLTHVAVERRLLRAVRGLLSGRAAARVGGASPSDAEPSKG